MSGQIDEERGHGIKGSPGVSGCPPFEDVKAKPKFAVPICRDCGRRIFTDSRNYEKRLADFRRMVGDDTVVLCDVCMRRVYEDAKRDILSQITVEQISAAMKRVYEKKVARA